MIKLYDAPLSGHAHKVRLFLSILGVPHDLVRVELGPNKSADFIALNPFGQVPVIDDDGTVIRDSNAILIYLAEKYDNGRWLPRDPIGRARVHEWLSVASNELVHGPALARAAVVFKRDYDHAVAVDKAHGLMRILETHLAGRSWLAGEQASIADISFYPYVSKAPEGKVPLDNYDSVRRWLNGVEALEGFIPMPEAPVQEG